MLRPRLYSVINLTFPTQPNRKRNKPVSLHIISYSYVHTLILPTVLKNHIGAACCSKWEKRPVRRGRIKRVYVIYSEWKFYFYFYRDAEHKTGLVDLFSISVSTELTTTDHQTTTTTTDDSRRINVRGLCEGAFETFCLTIELVGSTKNNNVRQGWIALLIIINWWWNVEVLSKWRGRQ